MARASFQKIKLLKKKNIGIVAITAYDASFARYFDELGFDIILIGDSLGAVSYTHLTLPTTPYV